VIAVDEQRAKGESGEQQHPDRGVPGLGLQGWVCDGTRYGLTHPSSLDGFGRYNKHLIEEQDFT
jgi:hypothetical protein